MARRKQAKQAAAETVVAVADGNVTPPKKRKTAAKSTTVDEPKQTKSRSRQAKANKQDNEVANEPVSLLKKTRSRQKNATDTATATAAAKTAKTGTKSRPKKKIDKEPEETTIENDDDEEVVEKKTRGGKAATVVKKAGKEVTEIKSKAKVPAARKQTRIKDVEDNAEDLEEKNTDNKKKSVKRPRLRGVKTVEEIDAPKVQPAAKVSRKRKNVKDMNEAIAEAQSTKEEEEDDDEEDKEEEEKEAKANKKLPGKRKKIETASASLVTSKGRFRKNPVEEIVKSPPKKTDRKKQNSKEQNAVIQEDLKTKNVKNSKKGNTKKAASKRKLYTAVEETIDDQAEESNEAEAATTSEVDVKANGDAHMAEPKQKKRNVGKATMAVNGKKGKQNSNEAKGKQKKGQVAAASVDEEEATQDVIAENEATETNAILEISENDTVVSSSKDGNILENEKEKDDSEANSIKEEPITEISNDERSASFVCL